ncbi:zinc-finger-containing protein [Azospirillum brasilense]|uniref:zinc-finger-containing protein n=1 Tax=Azospirillum brasilense TaxID=192 RepID=UPI000E68213A|nr:zinc-finger-containing protein [Azospirillum brasilense]NUB24646.1 hypothetical protein [Azospirillum brasilense]NUB35175.1 hypothetical protein [Azospirillum brasilense]RIW07715.1 hypothetical protein D2T81_02435 [Azospirillum brasilense]
MAVTLPTMPALKCPDCGAPMRLQPTPSTFKTPNPFVYLCDRRAAGCGGLMSAHPDGTPQGAPVAAELRRARRMTHQVFDRLWQTAPHYYPVAETGAARVAAFKRIQDAARNRAYAYVAAHLGMSRDACRIGKITDIETLRAFYGIARRATPLTVRDWWKKLQAEEAHLKPIPADALPALVGQPIRLKGAGLGMTWVLERIKGDTLFLRSPTNNRKRMACANQALYPRAAQPSEAP